MAGFLAIIQNVASSSSVTLRSVETATKVECLLLIFSAVFAKDWNFALFDHDSGGGCTSSMIGPSTLLMRALEASTPLRSAVQAFKIQSSFAYALHVCNNVLVVDSLDPRFWAIQGTKTMSFASIVGRQYFCAGYVVWAQATGRFDIILEAKSYLLDFSTGFPFPLVSWSALAFPLSECDHTGGLRCCHVTVDVIFIIFLVLVFLVLCLFVIGLFTSQLALYLINVYPDTVLSLGAFTFLGNLAHR